MSFADQYGPWAVISGATEGTGSALARRIAAEGVNCILVARRAEPLETLAASLSVETMVVPMDLAAPDSAAHLIAAIGERDIGLYVANAGSDPEGQHFLDCPVESWLAQVNRGVANLTSCCHHFGGSMKARGKGGLLLVGSGACYGGSAHMAVYAGVKAFALNVAEALWAELSPDGVDVLYAALGTTDTPEFRRFMAAHGLPLPDGLADPDAVAERLLACLPNGPLINWGLDDEERGYLPASAAERRNRTLMIGTATRRIFGK